MTGRRLDRGGRVDREAPLKFTFNGETISAFDGDTVASALLAAGTRVVSHSVLLGRPRGIISAGSEESAALIQVDEPFPEPMLLATTVDVVAGLATSSLNGQGRLAREEDPAAYDAAHLHCEVAVVGAGPAGLAAALAAAVTGARVVLLDERPTAGGMLLSDAEANWAATQLAELIALPNVTVLNRTMVTGYYDDNYLIAVQRRLDHQPAELNGTLARQRVWRIRSAEVVLATGAHERPIVFPGNDVPGVMLAEAVREYLLRYGVLAGQQVVLFTTHDDAYRVADDLLAAGAEVVVVDARPEANLDLVPLPAGAHYAGAVITGTSVNADGALTGVSVRQADGTRTELPCDLLAVSGGWNPAGQLFSQAGGALRFDDEIGAFVPGAAGQRLAVAGALRGLRTLSEIVDDGERAGAAAAEAAIGAAAAGRHEFVAAAPQPLNPPDDALQTYPEPGLALYLVSEPGAEPRSMDRSFVDIQRDVTVADLARATGAGMLSVELVKRYTTAGTAHDQGKTSGVLASGVVAELLGVSVGELGTTKYRPPYTPVGFAALAGRERGMLYDPIRTTGAHPWHIGQGAAFENVGQWKRPWFYSRPLTDGTLESMDQAVARECAAARTGVAFMDASTLGKIDVQGPDAGAFLDLLYTNLMSALKVGSVRYGAMCNVDGMILDDGTVFRLGEQHFMLTTTTGNAAKILEWMEEWLQTEWPHLRVWCTSVTEQWATLALVGPRSRELLASLAPGLDVDNEAFPFMTWRDASVVGLAARVARISFSGELAYEINVRWPEAAALWDAVWAGGAPVGLTPYGTETMHVLRAEKGYPIIGQDSDGTVTPQDLGMGWAISKKKPDYLGKRSHARAENARTDRKHLVGLLPDDPTLLPREGSQLVADAVLPAPPVPMLGHVTSSYHSVALGRTFTLALLAGGRDRIGNHVHVVLDGVPQPVLVTSSVLFDPDGARRDGIELEPWALPVFDGPVGPPVSPLAGFAERFATLSRPATAGVRISEAPLTTLIDFRVARDAHDAVAAEFGVALPVATNLVTGIGIESFLALGPDEFLLTSGPGHATELLERLQPLSDAATDVSGTRTMIRVSGRYARAVLAHGCGIDLQRLRVGHCAQTLLAQCAVVLMSDGPVGTDDDLIKILVRSTYAAHLAEWLLLTSAEYA